MEYKNCSFTGHRVINPEYKQKLTEILKRSIAYAYKMGVRNFFCGGAVGFDTMAAQEVLLFRLNHRDVKLNLILPCKNQSAKWSKSARDMYDYLLSEADTVEYLYDEYSRGCMHARNRKLVDSSDMLVAYVEKKSGGSYTTYQLAGKKGITTFNLYPTLIKELTQQSESPHTV